MPRPVVLHVAAALVVASLATLCVVSIGAEPATASGTTLVLNASVTQPAIHHYVNAGSYPLGLCTYQPGGPARVGYQHLASTSIFGDVSANCVYEVAVSFDLSGVHSYPGAVITRAQLTYSDDLSDVLDGDGNPVDSPHDVQQDAVWDSCMAHIAVPNDSWQPQADASPIDVLANSPDDSLNRLDRTTWDITSRARQWYTYDNTGLVLSGFDEGAQFSNNAACISTLDNFKLTLDVVYDQPTATPTPNTAQRALDNGRGVSRPLPTVSVRREGLAPFVVVTATPLPSNH